MKSNRSYTIMLTAVVALLTMVLTACTVSPSPSPSTTLQAAEAMHRTSPDSVKAYEDLLRQAIRDAECQQDWMTAARACLLLSAQLQWTDEPEAIRLAEQAELAARHTTGEEATRLRFDISLARAGLFEQMGDFSHARSLYLSCLENSASRNSALSRLANLCLSEGDAEEALQTALQMTPSLTDTVDIEPLFILANCYLQCDSLEQARTIYARLSNSTNSKTRYAANRHLAEIAIQEQRIGQLPEMLDSAFASAEGVFFEALKQKDAYFRATLEQERRNERLTYQQRLTAWALTGVTLVAVLVVAFLVVLIRHRRTIHRQRLEAAEHERLLAEQRLRFETQDREREAREAEERLLQQTQKVQLLQRFILDKNEVLQRLREEGDHKKQLSAKEWLDVEQMLDSITDGFVARLRALHPEFREEDIQLCMLTRMSLSNQVIASIYLITVSAVKHRKLKLKKDGFGELNPERPLDDVLNTIKT